MSERYLSKSERKIHPGVLAYDENNKPIFKKNIKETSILNKRNKGEKSLYLVIFIIMCIHSFTLIFPTAWMFMSSLKGRLEFGAGDPFAFPKSPEWNNYIEAFSMLDDTGGTTFSGLIFNSVWYTLVKTFLNVIIPAFCGYVMCKFRFFGREALFTYIIVTMTLPIYGSGAAYMNLVATLGYLDTPLYVFIANLGGFSTSFLVYYGFFKSVSNSYGEAAKIEGANAFQIFFKIILPQAMPVLLTYGIIGAIANWNAYEEMILYIPSYPTLASGLFEFKNVVDTRNFDTPAYFAGIIISAIPTLILFCTCSSKIMTSLSIGGLKG